MSYYLIDFSKKQIDFNFDNLVIGKKIKLDQDNCKYYLYYQTEQSETPCEIYVKLPKLRLIYNMANHKYDKISIPIYPNWDLTTSTIEWFKKFESDIQDCFSESKVQREFVSILSKANTLNLIKCYINDNPKITSNIENKSIGLADFKINGQIELVIKLSYIWGNKTKYGLSSSIYQIKYHGPPEQLEINFIDPEPQVKKPNIASIIASSIQTHPTQSVISTISNKPVENDNQKSDKPLPPQMTVKMIPTLKDLQKAIKSLKPVDDNNQ